MDGSTKCTNNAELHERKVCRDLLRGDSEFESLGTCTMIVTLQSVIFDACP